jgi:hypothetical protein
LPGLILLPREPCLLVEFLLLAGIFSDSGDKTISGDQPGFAQKSGTKVAGSFAKIFQNLKISVTIAVCNCRLF